MTRATTQALALPVLAGIGLAGAVVLLALGVDVPAWLAGLDATLVGATAGVTIPRPPTVG
jgi:hypothetical protein